MGTIRTISFNVLFLFFYSSWGQSIKKKSYDFHEDHLSASTTIYSFSSENEAKKIISKILTTVGLRSNFEIKAANVDNAAAVLYSGKRFILYNPVFINRIDKAVKTDWAGISILAHEIGHHLNGHTLSGKGSIPTLELEADEFSGFVLRKMGATLEEAQAVMRMISDEFGSATHPPRSQRLASIKMGWTHANEQIASIKGEIKKRVIVKEPKEKKQSHAIAPQYIYKEVCFLNSPNQIYYLTIRYNLVKVDNEGLYILGKMVKSNGNLCLMVNKSIYKIDAKGGLYNTLNKKVGYLRNYKGDSSSI